MDPLVSTAELVAFMQASVPGPTADLALSTASGRVRNHCGWNIAPPETITMVADGNGTQILTLPTLRLSAVDKVRIDDRLIDSGSYRWRSRGQLLYRHGWPEGMGNVEVDITHGYEETPDAVKAVVLALAAAMVDNPAGRVMAVVGAVTSQYGINLTTLQLAQLAGYTLP